MVAFINVKSHLTLFTFKLGPCKQLKLVQSVWTLDNATIAKSEVRDLEQAYH